VGRGRGRLEGKRREAKEAAGDGDGGAVGERAVPEARLRRLAKGRDKEVDAAGGDGVGGGQSDGRDGLAAGVRSGGEGAVGVVGDGSRSRLGQCDGLRGAFAGE
jgi:hypothetical protein